MDTFKIGEIAILCGLSVSCSRFNGTEVEVIGELMPREWDIYGTKIPRKGNAYLVTFQGVPQFCARPGELKKKYPPREPLGKWQALKDIWQPEKSYI